MSKTPVAWFQLIYQKSRLMVAIAGISFATLLIFTQLGLLAALYRSGTAMHRRIKGDLVMLEPATETYIIPGLFPRRRLYQALSFEGVESVSPIRFALQSTTNVATGRSRVTAMFGINPANVPFNIPDWEHYRPIVQLEDVILFDSKSRPEYGIDVANFDPDSPFNHLEVGGRRGKVDAVVDFIGVSFGSPGAIIVNDITFQNFAPNRDPEKLELGIITLDEDADPQQIRQTLEATLPQDIKILTIEEFIALEEHYWATSTAIGFIFSMGVVVGFLVGVIVVYQILYAEISDHVSDYAVMKARGYGQSYFIMMILQEALILSVMGYLPGYVFSLGLYRLVKTGTQLPIAMTVARSLWVLGLTFLMCFLSGGLAARKLKDVDPADLL